MFYSSFVDKYPGERERLASRTALVFAQQKMIITAMSLDQKYPSLDYLKHRAKRRLPHFVWEFLDSGTGKDATKDRNRRDLDAIKLMPSILHGEFTPNVSTSFLGETFDLPVGMAPVGMSGLIWPNAEVELAKAATELNVPYSLSTVAAQTIETIGPLTNGNGWFQLYPPKDEAIRLDMLKRAKDSGFSTLVLTVDVPVSSRRERQVHAGLSYPPRLSPRIIWQSAQCPTWSFGMLRYGKPKMQILAQYSDVDAKSLPANAHIGYLLRTSPDWEYLKWIRDHWDGPLIVKGVLDPEFVSDLQGFGVDALWISNHAGRQMDAGPSTISQLPKIREAPDLPLIFDSGAEGGLDVIRALNLGADFVMMGRAWHYALAALGPKGVRHFATVLKHDLSANMGQLGIKSLAAAEKIRRDT